ncbi:uncharacterized protein [Ptychodera flava]|uniref:uncharacterized protein n=1 Tax=Ptychodera flava TaxID=63121 RepID=UPI00396A8FA7
MAAQHTDDAPLITPVDEAPEEQRCEIQIEPEFEMPKTKKRPKPLKVNMKESSSLGYGIGHILLGASLFGLGIVSIFLGCQLFYYGTPAWCGAFFMATGVIGIVATQKKDQCIVIGYLVTSALSIAGALIVFVHGAYAFMKEENLPAYGDEDDYGYIPSSIQSRKAVDGVVTALAVMEFIIAIASTTSCAKALQQPLIPKHPQRAPIYMIPAVSVDGRVLNTATSSNNPGGAFYIPARKSNQHTMVPISMTGIMSNGESLA